MHPLISVIIPVYNVEKYLRECLDSVINQTYKNLEIILVNDGSPDNSGEICDEYARVDQRVIVIHKENSGVSSARNTALDIAKGEYISFIDSDDFVDRHFYEILYNNLIQYNADIAMVDTKRFYLNQQINKDQVPQPNSMLSAEHEAQKAPQAPHEFIKSASTKEDALALLAEDYESTNKWASTCSKLYKKDVIGNARFPARVKNDEDTIFNIRVYKNMNSLVFVKQELYYYRARRGSACSAKVITGFSECHRIIGEELEAFKDNPRAYKIIKKFHIKVVNHYLNYYTFDFNVKKHPKINECVKIIRKNTLFILTGSGVYSPKYKIAIVVLFFNKYLYKLIYKKFAKKQLNYDRYFE